MERLPRGPLLSSDQHGDNDTRQPYINFIENIRNNEKSNYYGFLLEEKKNTIFCLNFISINLKFNSY